MASPDRDKATKGSEGEGMYLAGQRATGKFRAPGVGGGNRNGAGEGDNGTKTCEKNQITNLR